MLTVNTQNINNLGVTSQDSRNIRQMKSWRWWEYVEVVLWIWYAVSVQMRIGIIFRQVSALEIIKIIKSFFFQCNKVCPFWKQQKPLPSSEKRDSNTRASRGQKAVCNPKIGLEKKKNLMWCDHWKTCNRCLRRRKFNTAGVGLC